MAEISFRRAVPADVPALYALDLLCFDEPFRFSLASMRRCSTEAGAVAILAEQGSEPLGFIIVSLRSRGNGRTAYLATLDVHPAHRRQGLARLLLTRSEQAARIAGATRIRLHVFIGNYAAIHFYEASGFQRGAGSAEFYGPSLDAWTYEKSLNLPGG